MTAADRPETIFALATGRPPAAIGIVRISGARAWEIAESLCGRLPPPRRATLRDVRDPADGALLDRGLLLLFPAEGSPTGEAVAELHLHGGRAVIDAVLDCLGRQPGARMARPGEFTWRAFENGRLDLTAVEGLGDLLTAETESQRRAALALVDGGFAARITDWRRRLIDQLALVEAQLDFADEEDVPPSPLDRTSIDVIGAEMRAFLDRPSTERLRGEIDVVIAGPPNAGKSTLLNALVGRNVAIVSPVAGTTRDIIAAPVLLRGNAIRLVDTAGMRVSDDEVERIGVDRARRAADAADLVLWLGGEPPSSSKPNYIHVFARADDRLDPPPIGAVSVSAWTGEGLEHLIAMIAERCRVVLPNEDAVLLNRRQAALVEEASTEMLTASGLAEDLILTAEHLRGAIAALDRLTGATYVESVLDSVFERFCIGK